MTIIYSYSRNHSEQIQAIQDKFGGSIEQAENAIAFGLWLDDDNVLVDSDDIFRDFSSTIRTPFRG